MALPPQFMKKPGKGMPPAKGMKTPPMKGKNAKPGKGKMPMPFAKKGAKGQ